MIAFFACGGEPSPRPPNVLLISLDSTRRDLLSAYGHRAPHAPSRPTSPNLDRLAAEGVLMEDAYATTSWTLPSHVALMSGEPDLVHAVDLDNQRPDPARPLLAEILRGAGYRTAGFFTGPYLGPQFGFDRGFERYESRFGAPLEAAVAADAALRESDAGSAALAEAEREVQLWSHRDVSSRAVTDAALEELDRAAEDPRPFFLFVHYFDPHYDYVPPAPHDTAFDPAYTGAIDGVDFITSEAISTPDPVDPYRRRRVVSERDLEHVRALYAGELEATDAEIGRLLDRLDERGLRDDTLVVVFADHGAEFFEHGSIGHRQTLYEEVVRVPLIMRLPGRLPAGRRVQGLVSLSDVLPTVLDLVGVPAPPALASRSLLPLLADGAGPEERAVLGRVVTLRDGLLEVPDGADGWVPVRLVRFIETYRRGPIKITRERRQATAKPGAPPAQARALAAENARLRRIERLTWVDLDRDPGEGDAAQSADFSEPRARAALEAFREEYARLLARRRAAAPAEVDEATRARLRALGYAEGDPGASATDGFALPLPGEAVVGADPG